MYVGSFILGVTKSGKSRGFGYLYGGIDRERLDHILSNSRTPTFFKSQHELIVDIN